MNYDSVVDDFGRSTATDEALRQHFANAIPREQPQEQPQEQAPAPRAAPSAYSFFPNQSYFDKGWAPESIPASSLQALAKAESLAVKNGVLSPALAQKFLANALVEGHTGGQATETVDAGEEGPGSPEHVIGKTTTAPMFGADFLGYTGPTVQRNMKAMGLTTSGDADLYSANQGAGFMPGKPFDAYSNARIAAVILAEKARLYGEDKAVERWNGQGPGAVRHAAKVDTMTQMLSDPRNKALMDAYNKFKGQ